MKKTPSDKLVKPTLVLPHTRTSYPLFYSFSFPCSVSSSIHSLSIPSLVFHMDASILYPPFAPLERPRLPRKDSWIIRLESIYPFILVVIRIQAVDVLPSLFIPRIPIWGLGMQLVSNNMKRHIYFMKNIRRMNQYFDFYLIISLRDYWILPKDFSSPTHKKMHIYIIPWKSQSIYYFSRYSLWIFSVAHRQAWL